MSNAGTPSLSSHAAAVRRLGTLERGGLHLIMHESHARCWCSLHLPKYPRSALLPDPSHVHATRRCTRSRAGIRAAGARRGSYVAYRTVTGVVCAVCAKCALHNGWQVAQALSTHGVHACLHLRHPRILKRRHSQACQEPCSGCRTRD